MDLTSFRSLNRISREFEVVEGLKVSLHTLSVLEQQNALAEIPVPSLGSVEPDFALRTLVLQQALLVYALDSINGEKVDLKTSKDFVQNLQAPIFNEIYSCYDVMAQEQNATMSTLTEFKKKIMS